MTWQFAMKSIYVLLLYAADVLMVSVCVGVRGSQDRQAEACIL